MVSIGGGRKATDACECMSLELLSNGKCGESLVAVGRFMSILSPTLYCRHRLYMMRSARCTAFVV